MTGTSTARLSPARSVDTARGRFACRTAGPPDGPAVLLLHGWPSSSACWRPVVDALHPSLHVVAPDLRGHGDSTRAGERSDFRKAELAADVLAVLDELGIGRVRAAGHDWGGAVAQELALAAPHRVTQLALLGCPALNNPAGERAAVSAFGSEGGTALWYQHFQQQRGLPEAMIPGNEGTWLRHFLRDGRGQPLADEVIAETVRWYSLPGTPAACANLYRALRADRQHWETLRGHVWPMPGLYLYGAHDPVVLPAYAAAVEPCFASVTVRALDAGHFLPDEAPEEVAAHLNAFLVT